MDASRAFDSSGLDNAFDRALQEVRFFLEVQQSRYKECPGEFENAPLFQHHYKALISGLLFACPVNRRNPETCPIHTIREILQNKDEKSWRQIHDFLESLNEEQSKALYMYHHGCLSIKEKEPIGFLG